MRSNKTFQGVYVSKTLPFSLLTKRSRQSLNVQVRGVHIAEAQMHVDTLPLLLESSSPTDRRQQTLSFSLTGDQLGKMKAPGCVFCLYSGLPPVLIRFGGNQIKISASSVLHFLRLFRRNRLVQDQYGSVSDGISSYLRSAHQWHANHCELEGFEEEARDSATARHREIL